MSEPKPTPTTSQPKPISAAGDHLLQHDARHPALALVLSPDSAWSEVSEAVDRIMIQAIAQAGILSTAVLQLEDSGSSPEDAQNSLWSLKDQLQLVHSLAMWLTKQGNPGEKAELENELRLVARAVDNQVCGALVTLRSLCESLPLESAESEVSP